MMTPVMYIFIQENGKIYNSKGEKTTNPETGPPAFRLRSADTPLPPGKIHLQIALF
jgi:hypothetical protein